MTTCPATTSVEVIMSDTSFNGTASERPFRSCTEVSDLCPVERTVLGYYPNFGANIFFAIGFGLLVILSGGLGFWKRTWTFTAAVTGGTLLETVGKLCASRSIARRYKAYTLATGYVGRVLLNNNPWDSGAFQLQICAIILGPTFICVGVYLTLKHVTLNLNPRLSRLPPRLYPWIFLPADLSCLIVQAIGGGLAAAAGDTNKALLDGGNRAIIAGVALQVVVLLIFGVLGIDYWIRLRRWVHAGEAEGQSSTESGEDADTRRQATGLYRDPKFRKFVYAIAGAFAAILTRCIYRYVKPTRPAP